MRQDSLRVPATSTQKRDIAVLASIDPPARFDAGIRIRTDQIRSLLREHLPHGVKRAIAEQLGLRPESVTRQLDPQRTERLTEDVSILAQVYLEQVGQEAAAREVRNLRYAGVSTVTLTLPPGHETWEFVVNVKTGEVLTGKG